MNISEEPDERYQTADERYLTEQHARRTEALKAMVETMHMGCNKAVAQGKARRALKEAGFEFDRGRRLWWVAQGYGITSAIIYATIKADDDGFAFIHAVGAR